MTVVDQVVTPTSIAQALEADLRAGVPQRRSIDARALVASPAMPNSVAAYLDLRIIEGTSTSITKIAPTVTPAGQVAENAAKPEAATVTTSSVNLTKYAGRATFSLEASRSSAGLEAAVYYALAGQALLAYEYATCVEIMAGGTTQEYATGKMIEGIFSGMGTVLANGGRPSLLIVNPADLPTIGSTFLSSDPADGVAAGRVAGAAVHVSAGMAPGEAAILDPAGLAALWHAESPMVLVDPFSQSSTNGISVVVDLLAHTSVTHPGLVVEITPAA